MAIFRNDSRDWERLDWRLLQNGAVVLYHRAAVLAEDTAWLQRADYRVFTLDASRWQAPAQFHEDAQRVLGFPEYYGKNLAAWVDHLGELEVPEQGGVALQLRHFDTFARAHGNFAQTILDSLEIASRRQMLFGRRLLALVQSDDPRIRFERVGAMPVTWNPREAAESDRLGVP